MVNGYDLNGVWRDGKFPTRIEHVGTALVARWLYLPYECEPNRGGPTLPTDLNFEASISGNYISGQTTTCSTKGLTMASFELTVSDDGNTLAGHWWSEDPPRDETMQLTRCLAWEEDDELEQRDNHRWAGLNLPEVSWYWPASFYMTVNTDGTGVFQGQQYSLINDAWITTSGYFHKVDPGDMIAGDVIVFRGKQAEGEVRNNSVVFTEKRSTPRAVAHSAIATGRGDQVSQMWWTREVRQMMKRDGLIMIPPPEAPGPQNGGYAVTRDTIRSLISEFADRDGDIYLVSPYEVWRRPNLNEPDFGDLPGQEACDCWPPRHLVQPSRTGGFLRP